MPDDLVARLKAGPDADEAAANEVHRPRDCGSVDRDGEFDSNPIYCGCGYPARKLREVAAYREILARYEDCAAQLDADEYGVAKVPFIQVKEYEDFVLPALAAIYSDDAT